MGTLMRGRRIFGSSAIASGTDSVIAGMWVPSGAIITGIQGSINLVGATAMTLAQACFYGVEAWIVPVDDPDSTPTMDALWDANVPKDTEAQELDLDVAAADATPFYEPGSIMWEALFDIGSVPQRIYHRHKVCSAVNASQFQRQDVETPFLEHWFPSSIEGVNIRRSYRVREPSAVMFAVSIPDTIQTNVSAFLAAFAEHEWGQMKYVDHMMEMALMSLLGLTEAGAETPWTDAAELLRKVLEPQVLEKNAGTFVATSWGAFGELVFDVVVPGRIPSKVLTGGR